MESANLASRSKRQGRLFVAGRQPKKLSHIDSKPSSKPVEQIDTCAEISALNVANGRAIDVSINAQRLLTQPFEGSDTAQIPGDAGSTLHGPQAINLRTIKPSDISDIITVCCRTLKMGAFVRLVGAFVRHAIILAVMFGAASAACAQEDPDPSHVLDIYEGWWAFGGAPKACDIVGPDSQKVAIGRYQMSDDGPVFGKGTPKVGTLDATCELHQPESIDGAIEAVSVCTADGEQLVGRTRFLGSDGAIEVQSPIGRFELARCQTDADLNAPLDLSLEQPTFADPQSAETRADQMSPVGDDQPQDVTSGPDQRPALSPVAPNALRADGEIITLRSGVVITQRPLDLPQPTLKSEGERNAIVAVYADYCDPSFLEELSGYTDPSYYDRYKNQLLVRYAASCERYLRDQVFSITSIGTVTALYDFPPGPAGLDDKAAIFVGLWLFLSHAPEVKACVPIERLDSDGSYGSIASILIPLRTDSDLENIAIGYGLGLGGMRQQARFGCEAITYVLGLSTTALIQSPMVKFPGL